VANPSDREGEDLSELNHVIRHLANPSDREGEDLSELNHVIRHLANPSDREGEDLSELNHVIRYLANPGDREGEDLSELNYVIMTRDNNHNGMDGLEIIMLVQVMLALTYDWLSNCDLRFTDQLRRGRFRSLIHNDQWQYQWSRLLGRTLKQTVT
jgi:hypothetical protein